MVGEERAREVVEAAITACRSDAAEAVLRCEVDNLTRFANSEIHQNTSVVAATLYVRAVCGTREGWATTNQLTAEAAQETAARAVEIAMVQPENPDFPGLAGPATYEEADGYDEDTASLSSRERAALVQEIVALADTHQLIASGALRTRVTGTAIANSEGVRAWMQGSDSAISTVIMTGYDADAGSGYAEAASRSVSDLDVRSIGERAVEKCLSSVNPGSLEPGEYEAVLEPAAVVDCMNTLAYMGINGISFIEGRSYASGRIGSKVTSDMVTIEDNWHDPGLLPLPFDLEGVPRRPVMLIERGVASGMIFDRFSAKKAETESTGHALVGGGLRGGYPLHLVMSPGESSLEEMVAGTKRGIYVTRFNYTNVVHPIKTILTGMTRDGTYLIEDGRIVRPLRNLRFTDSILDGIFANIVAMSRDTELLPVAGGRGIYRAPAIKTAKLNFIGTTA
ncbi:MAG: TldD/PmbA family protein [Firmicutes bacterium]|nr:TldD/PmbA family protein [Bacillota bacterium]